MKSPPSHRTSLALGLWQAHEQTPPSLIVQTSQTCYRIPPTSSSKRLINATPLVRARHDIIEHFWITIQDWVDKPDRSFTSVHALAVDQRYDRSEHWV
jgi:hypothetical protein